MSVALETNWSRYNPTLNDVDSKILEYFKKHPHRPKDQTYLHALELTRKDFHLPSKVPIRHVNDVIRHYPHPDRSPGLPYTKLGIRKKSDVDTNLIRWNIHKVKYGKIKKFKAPCSVAAKTVVSPPGKNKFRVIWVYPVDMTIMEGMFAQPLIHAYNSMTWTPYAIWWRWHKGDMHKLNSLRGECNWLGTDYSAFDVHVPPWLIRDAFNILRENLDFSRYEFYGAPTDSWTIDTLWSEVVRYFINTPAKLKSGRIVVKEGGVPSGSYFTNMIDSVCNAVMTHYVLTKLNVQYYEHFFMGDDGLVRFSGSLDLMEFAKEAKSTFGCVVNPDKSEIGPFVNWLGYKLAHDKPRPDLDKLIAQLLVPSKRDIFDHDILIRARALWICSFNYPPFRDILLEYDLLTNIKRVYRDDTVDRLEYLNLDISCNAAYLHV